jgi:hypothetical protein
VLEIVELASRIRLIQYYQQTLEAAKGQLVQQSQMVLNRDRKRLVCLLVIIITATLELRLRFKEFSILPLEIPTSSTKIAMELPVSLCRN